MHGSAEKLILKSIGFIIYKAAECGQLLVGGESSVEAKYDSTKPLSKSRQDFDEEPEADMPTTLINQTLKKVGIANIVIGVVVCLCCCLVIYPALKLCIACCFTDKTANKVAPLNKVNE